jgi:hypothetical protein
MGRSKQSDARDTHHTVSAGVLESVGKGFLISTATVVAGITFGTAHLAAMGLYMLGVAAIVGVACMIASALVRNAGHDRCEQKPAGVSRATHARKAPEVTPAVDAASDVAPEERWARRVAASGRQREHGLGTGRGI